MAMFDLTTATSHRRNDAIGLMTEVKAFVLGQWTADTLQLAVNPCFLVIDD